MENWFWDFIVVVWVCLFYEVLEKGFGVRTVSFEGIKLPRGHFSDFTGGTRFVRVAVRLKNAEEDGSK